MALAEGTVTPFKLAPGPNPHLEAIAVTTRMRLRQLDAAMMTLEEMLASLRDEAERLKALEALLVI